MSHKISPMDLEKRRAKRSGVNTGMHKVGVQVDSHRARMITRARAANEGFIVYDETSELTVAQMKWLMEHIEAKRKAFGLITVSPGEDAVMRHETQGLP